MRAFTWLALAARRRYPWETPSPAQMTTPSSDTIDLSNADHMGDLARGGTTWSVHLETRQDGPVAAGRVHFVAGDVRRSSAWIFREWSVLDVKARFAEFSPLELWRLLESLS